MPRTPCIAGVFIVFFVYSLQALHVSLGHASGQATGQGAPAAPASSPLADLVRACLWPTSDAQRQEAERRLQSDPSLTGLTRTAFHDLEEAMRQGPPRLDAAPAADDPQQVQELTVEIPAGPAVPVLVRLPPRYTPETEWPLIFAMHGGPPGQVAQARSGAERMLRVWTDAAARAGWIVAAPVMTPTVAAGPRTDDRLPYEIFHPEQAQAVIAMLRARYRINSDRVVSTGISLGSNYSIAFAAGDPGLFAAIVPVSTEGDSRELLLRNLGGTPVYVLEGTRDRNIRIIDAPRALTEILVAFGYDITYREFTDRAHEGFQEHYGDVLRWLDARPRQIHPREVVRVPHPAIVPVSRRVRWIESDTRQGLVRAVALPPDRIEITAAWARRITLFLHDRLVDLDRPITVTINGVEVHKGLVARSAATALEEARRLGDERRIYAARLTLDVPVSTPSTAAAAAFASELAPVRTEAPLSFWEMYATRALQERWPAVGFSAAEVPLPRVVTGVADQVALQVTTVEPGSAVARAGLRAGDTLIEFGGEPFFRGRGISHLYAWVLRELRSVPQPFALRLVRNGTLATLDAELQLGPYRSPPSGGVP
jgi:predicted esterase